MARCTIQRKSTVDKPEALAIAFYMTLAARIAVMSAKRGEFNRGMQ
ncbi:UNVERIFIED_ORG: hypothetical protein M2154_000801 [Enterobacter sp. JUb101]|jgi:hypothetical protein|nr:hypothetical protein [Lelliottia amnigena]